MRGSPLQVKLFSSAPSPRVSRDIHLPGGKVLRATPIFDTYWRFAAERQEVFFRRLSGAPTPWTDDPVLRSFRFTNVYRASDRVSQYLIRRVVYEGPQEEEEVFFRVLLFKLFNRIETWELLEARLGELTWKSFDFSRADAVLSAAIQSGVRLYSAAYIMPSPLLGLVRKHSNHLELLRRMMADHAPRKVVSARSLREVFQALRAYPSLGDFLAYQFAIDLNYSELMRFEESEFVVAGPGARSGIGKCFSDTGGMREDEVIYAVTRMAEQEFSRLGLGFRTLWGRALQPIDCQNLFCEVDKYSRVVHPEATPEGGRTRIKQRYESRPGAIPHWYPPKWKLFPGLT
ncbi:nucleotide kinase domain-containing protein [Myxococcus xanthus]|uniref:nucleotide kinase domain-containing protein n=1 Tax=Myxococcus xanthus TaxID=34 RepID=UPI0013757C3A|nr:nucleotide kinase domain-containing protein [Myxococcus xanthus]